MFSITRMDVDSNTGEMNLLHPFSRTQIPLPSREDLMASKGRLEEKLFWSCIDKVVSSANPSVTSDFILVVNYQACSNHLAFWRPPLDLY